MKFITAASTFSFFLFLLLFLPVTAPSQTDSCALRLNQIQILASHNSYKKPLDPKVFAFLQKMKKTLGKNLNPDGIDYGHLPFEEQFDKYHIRGLEIDFYNDPKGGLFYKRRINEFIHGMKRRSGIAELLKPGMKVLHIKDVDYNSTYYSLVEALRVVKNWSDAHPNHIPLFINLETKNDGPGDANGFLRFLGFKRSIPFDEAAADSIDAEIKSVFGADLKGILTPDIARGHFNSLDEMASIGAWLPLEKCRGKVIFIMEGGAVSPYLKNHVGLAGRACFVYSEPGRPECAFVIRNEPKQELSDIQKLVKKGYIVRTRADADTREARANDYSRMLYSFNSGAQIISTDYYKQDNRFSNYRVRFPKEEIIRRNPQSTKDVRGCDLKE